MNKANRGVAVFAAVLVIALLAAFLGGGFSPSLPNSPYIAVINITGTISHALSKDLILVTNNTREFCRVAGLKLEDWTIA